MLKLVARSKFTIINSPWSIFRTGMEFTGKIWVSQNDLFSALKTNDWADRSLRKVPNEQKTYNKTKMVSLEGLQHLASLGRYETIKEIIRFVVEICVPAMCSKISGSSVKNYKSPKVGIPLSAAFKRMGANPYLAHGIIKQVFGVFKKSSQPFAPVPFSVKVGIFETTYGKAVKVTPQGFKFFALILGRKDYETV